jgi:hypothetical protein
MARDRLDTLLRLRRMAVQDRIRDLAAAIRAEEQACRTQAACTEAMARETAEARRLADHDAALAGFMPWRARATRALLDAETQVTNAGAATHTARAQLGEARGAMRAVELAVDRRKADADLAEQRSAQHAFDDATRRSGGGAR